MVAIRDIVRNELMNEIVSIRVDTLWKMFALKKDGRLPRIDDEGATGDFDNKGAMFVPGCLVFEDSDKKAIAKKSYKGPTVKEFKRAVRDAMRLDNATLLYPDGIATGVNLDNGFFAEVSGNILEIKQAATRRKTIQPAHPPARINSQHVTRSNCPTYINPPYGSRTKLSSCLAVCLGEPRLYYAVCRAEFGLRGTEEADFWEGIAQARKPVLAKDGTVLAPPFIIVCHATRYREEIYTGITRILGVGRFGEFATFTIEEATNDLLNEIEGGKDAFSPSDVIAEFDGTPMVAVIRIFPKTTPGKRLARTTTKLISPAKDLDLNIDAVTKEARARYNI
jgi:hypothetical protein